MPIIGAQVPSADQSARFGLDLHREFGASLTATLSRSNLQKVDRRDAKTLSQGGRTASW